MKQLMILQKSDTELNKYSKSKFILNTAQSEDTVADYQNFGFNIFCKYFTLKFKIVSQCNLSLKNYFDLNMMNLFLFLRPLQCRNLLI